MERVRAGRQRRCRARRMNDPIERFLADLRASLPFDHRTSEAIVREARDHLMSSRRMLCNEGFADTQAQSEAIARFGPINEFIRRLETEGGPFMTRDWKSSPTIAGVLIIPALLFVIANLLAFRVFSNRFLYHYVVQPVLDQPWSAIPANLIITLGPLLALLISARQIVTLKEPEHEAGPRQAIVQLKWGHVVVVLVSFVLVAALGSYLFFENLPHL